MRIILKYRTDNDILPINNQHIVNAYIHKCLGEDNEYHDEFSEYNISFLMGGKLHNKEELIFKDKAFIIVSSPNNAFINDLIEKVYDNPKILGNIELESIEHITEKFYNGLNHFSTLTPIFLKDIMARMDKDTYTLVKSGVKDKRDLNHRRVYITIKNNSNFKEYFKRYLIKCLNVGMGDDFDSDKFDVIITDKNPKVKFIKIKNNIVYCSLFNFTLVCNKKVAEYFYNMGIGHSRGSGFGTICTTQKREEYFRI